MISKYRKIFMKLKIAPRILRFLYFVGFKIKFDELENKNRKIWKMNEIKDRIRCARQVHGEKAMQSQTEELCDLQER